jgi:biotin carboxyl carrier protein
MYKITVNESASHEVVIQDNIISINNHTPDWDLKNLPGGAISILMNGKSYEAIVENIDRATKKMALRINGNIYEIAIQEPIDQMLAKMGMDITKNQKAEPIKAPMPGMVLKILVTPGQQLKKGDPVLILEAMKMENVFKAPTDAVVKTIRAEERKAVEKGEVLIELE